MTKTINGVNYEAVEGTYIELDGQKVGKTLKGGQWWDGVDGWDHIKVSWPDPIFEDSSIAITVEITGRTIQYRDGLAWVRVAVTFVGDGEPDSVVRGFATVRSLKEVV